MPRDVRAVSTGSSPRGEQPQPRLGVDVRLAPLETADEALDRRREGARGAEGRRHGRARELERRLLVGRAHHRRVGEREVGDAHVDAPVGELAAQAVRERLDAGLARAVGAHQRRRGQRREGGDLQDVAAAVDDRRQERPDGADAAEQVDLEDLLVRRRVLQEQRAAEADAGVGDERVDPAEVGQHLLRRLLEAGRVGDVDLPRRRVRTARSGGRAQQRTVSVEQRDAPAAGREAQGHRRADAVGRTCDDRDASHGGHAGTCDGAGAAPSTRRSAACGRAGGASLPSRT